MGCALLTPLQKEPPKATPPEVQNLNFSGLKLFAGSNRIACRCRRRSAGNLYFCGQGDVTKVESE